MPSDPKSDRPEVEEAEGRQETEAPAAGATPFKGSGNLQGKKPRWWLRWWAILAGVLLLATVSAAVWVWWLVHDLPDSTAIKRYRPYLSTQVRDAKGRLLFSLGRRRNRLWRPLKKISPWLVKAVVTSEDDSFFDHPGYRVGEMWKAFSENLDKGRYARGASTITQQLARNAFLSKEKTITRKIKELFLARRIEEAIPKERILELYLNEVEWGDGIYGAQTASSFYFDKSAGDLNLAEAALLAGMLPNPKYFNPFQRLEEAKRKQTRVLDLMLHNKVISPGQHQVALEVPLRFSSPQTRDQFARRRRAPKGCVPAVLTRYLEKNIGEARLYRGGTKIFLTLDREVQRELADRFGAGSDDWLLVVREEGVIRAFACVGGTQWESLDVQPRAVSEETPAWEEGHPPREELAEEFEATIPQDQENPSYPEPFPYALEKTRHEDFLKESLLLEWKMEAAGERDSRAGG